jgi:hypothetical protein
MYKNTGTLFSELQHNNNKNNNNIILYNAVVLLTICTVYFIHTVERYSSGEVTNKTTRDMHQYYYCCFRESN